MTGWSWLRVGLSYAHTGHYDKAAKILQSKALTWKARNPENLAKVASYANPVIEAIQAGDHRRVRELFAQWEQTAIAVLGAAGANLSILC
jgi:hypothetical protein